MSFKFLHLILNDFINTYHAFIQLKRFAIISEFSNHLKLDGKKHNALNLIEYTKAIHDAIDNFDIDTLGELIHQFPAIVDSFSKD